MASLAAAPTAPPRTRRTLALFALALGSFGIGASEFSTMGLLPQIADGLLTDLMHANPDQGLARAGWLISAYAVGVVVGAPVLSLLAVRLSRRGLILALTAALAVAIAASALMPSFGGTMVARFAAGLPHGAYLGVASLIASSLMGPGSEGRGAALALSGLTVANLIGVPALTAIGQAAGWRWAYLLIAALMVLTVVLLLMSIPADDKPVGRRILDELHALRRTQLWAVLLIASIGMAGSFTVFSYIADIVEQLTTAGAGYVPWLLAAAGAGMTIGNVLGGLLADRGLFATLLGAFPLYIASMVGLALTVHSAVGLTVFFVLVNLVHSVISPAMQAWLMRISGRSEVLGASLHHAAFNVANAIGALLGGAVISSGWGLGATTVVGALVASTGYALLIGAVVLLRVRARRRLAQLREAALPFTAEDAVEAVDPHSESPAR